jgi:uncharacterized protein (DUF302 family)
MQIEQAIGIDPPLKALAWEDAGGKVWLSWNDPAWLASRHGIAAGGELTKALAAALAAAAKTAAGP